MAAAVLAALARQDAMNIAFLSSDYPPNIIGGVGIYTYQWARHLAKKGHGAFVITAAAAAPCEYVEQGVRVWRVLPARASWLEPARALFPESVRRLEYSMAVSRQLREVSKRYRIDLVESCESRAEGFWYFFTHRRPRLVIKLHTPDALICRLNQAPLSPDLMVLLVMEEWWLRRATALIGLTDALTAQVGRIYRLPVGRIPKARVPVDTRYFIPAKAGPGEADLEILYVGRMEFRKGVHVLLRALPSVLKEVPDARLTLIGPDAGMREVIEKAQQHPACAGRITWRRIGSREDLRTAYQRCALCVVPSLWENHPTVCLEAMSCGAAVVASRAGGIPEIIDHGIDGWLVPAGSSLALARAMTSLLRDHAARRSLGQNARSKMARAYDLETVFEETVSLYEQLLTRAA